MHFGIREFTEVQNPVENSILLQEVKIKHADQRQFSPIRKGWQEKRRKNHYFKE